MYTYVHTYEIPMTGVRWNRVNRHLKVIDLASGNLRNRHQLKCSFTQSAFRTSPTRCIIGFKTLVIDTNINSIILKRTISDTKYGLFDGGIVME